LVQGWACEFTAARLDVLTPEEGFMRFVDKAPGRPGVCAVFPQFGGQHDRGYLQTGTVLPGWDPEIVISVQAVEEMVRQLGWPTVQDHADAVAELERALARVEHLEADLEEANRTLTAIDVIESKDFRARKKAGRPRKETPEAA
jgi:hypothetical protein